MRNLEDIYTELKYPEGQFSEWVKDALELCEKGRHYVIEEDAAGNKKYMVSDVAAIVILDGYLEDNNDNPNLTKEYILNIAATSDILAIKAMSRVPIKFFDYFMIQIMKAYNCRSKIK